MPEVCSLHGRPPADSGSEVESRPLPSQPMVWYASYGSNMWRDRFLCYIQGGKVMPETASHNPNSNHTKYVLHLSLVIG